MRRAFLIIPLLIAGCQSFSIPDSFKPIQIHTASYTFASWQKDSGSSSPVRIYIEGDGRAFYHNGRPTGDPTPKGVFFRKIAFGDPNPNVVYLARPCQYIMSPGCTQKDWTTGRFSEAIVRATEDAIRQIAKGREVVLIGYSGGALLSGLVIERTDVPVKKWITIAGLLDHESWTRQSKLVPLTGSLNLKSLPTVSQTHYIGSDDRVISPNLYRNQANVVIVPEAGHDYGFDSIVPLIYR